MTRVTDRTSYKSDFTIREENLRYWNPSTVFRCHLRKKSLTDFSLPGTEGVEASCNSYVLKLYSDQRQIWLPAEEGEPTG